MDEILTSLAAMLGKTEDETMALLEEHLDVVAELLASATETPDDETAEEAEGQHGMRRALTRTRQAHGAAAIRARSAWVEDKIKARCRQRGVPYFQPAEADSIVAEMRHRKIVKRALRR